MVQRLEKSTSANNQLKKAIVTTFCLLPNAVIAHPGSGMMHASQHLLWSLAAAVVVIAAIGFLFRKQSNGQIVTLLSHGADLRW